MPPTRIGLCFLCTLVIAYSSAAVMLGVTGVFDEMAVRCFWPAALALSNQTYHSKEDLRLVILGPESQVAGTEKLRRVIAGLSEYANPSPNDTTMLAAEIQRLEEQAFFLTLWSPQVGKNVRQMYKRKDERFGVFEAEPKTPQSARLLLDLYNHLMPQVVKWTTIREPNVAISLQAYRVRSLSVASAPFPQQQTSLITHCTIDRLPRLKAQVLSWGGVTSVAIYIRPGEPIAPVMEFAHELAGSEIPTLQVDIALVHGLHSSQEYPINTVRNAALVQARRQNTSLVFMVDVDFVTSTGLRALLDTAAVEEVAQTTPLVVPAFERVKPDGPVPVTFERLTSEYAVKDTAVFHRGHCHRCHASTDYDRWFNDSATAFENRQIGYRIGYEEFYEPYVVVAKHLMHWYDERFVGYGFNKQTQLLHTVLAGHADREMTVLLRGFIIAQEHGTTHEWKRLMTQQSWYRFNKIAAYYNVKMEMLKKTYKPFLSRATRTALHTTTLNTQRQLSAK